jgi:hypothetical protein
MPGQPGACCLEHGKVANAGLIAAFAVVHDQYVAVLGGLERLERDVDAAAVAGGQHPSGNLGADDESGDSRRRATLRNPDAGCRRRGSAASRAERTPRTRTHQTEAARE